MNKSDSNSTRFAEARMLDGWAESRCYIDRTRSLFRWIERIFEKYGANLAGKRFIELHLLWAVDSNGKK